MAERVPCLRHRQRGRPAAQAPAWRPRPDHRFAHVVEGRYVTTAQIAERLGVSMTTAYDRARRGPFPLTWSALTERPIPR